MTSELVKSRQTELADNRLQDEADAFFERVMKVYRESFITNDSAVGMFAEDKQLLARQLYEYANTRNQITDQSGGAKPIRMARSAEVLLSRLKIMYDWRKERFNKPEPKQIGQVKQIEQEK